MADINNSLGKRKSLCSQIIFELEDDPEELPISPNSLNVEPVLKVTKKEEITETSDSNLYQELSQTSVETNISILEKLTELQEENMKLRRQLEEMNNKICKCSLNLSSSDETDNKEALITVKFHEKSVAEEYRNKFMKFLKSFIELTYTEDNLNIVIEKKKNKAIDLIDEISPSKKRKRKKSKSKSRDLFVVDTTPSEQKTESILKYVSKYSVTHEVEIAEKDTQKCTSLPTCFNCEQNHSLKDCPEPKNYAKINAARNKMRQHQINKTRYHTDEDQKYSHLRPGEISTELKKALGICSNELPSYIYKMRVCGYPPGWMEDARVTHSNISLYGIDGKEQTSKNNGMSFDPKKVVEYAGFNIPMDKEVKDDYQCHHCPPYSEKYSKTMMLEYINKMLIKEQDNLETCDMDLDQSSDETIQPPGCEPQVEKVCNRLSPSLTDLELKKMELLAELGDNNTNNSTIDEKSHVAEKNKLNARKGNNANDSINLGESFIVLDDSEVIEENEKRSDTCGSKIDSVNTGVISDSVVVGATTPKVDRVVVATTPKVDSVAEATTPKVDGVVEATTPKVDSVVEATTPKIDSVVEATTPKVDSKVDCVVKSTYGTPIVKTGSPYGRLPDPDKFSKDISPVINFENLPNATGKYEQMNNILQKVRRTLKHNYNL